MIAHSWLDRRESTSLFERLTPARERLARSDAGVLATQVTLCEIAAPTGEESARAAFVASRLTTLGLERVRTDDVGNVIAVRPGRDPSAAPVLVCAHLDTVFPAGTPVRVTREGTHLCAPGIVDNSRGLAGLLAIAAAIDGRAVITESPVIFAATVGEEGTGNLRGIKHLFARLDSRPLACVALDGAGDDRIVTTALGSRRLRVTLRGVGGHSWSSWGVVNPVHAAGGIIARLAALPLPRAPRTTLSVCRMGGGISVNAIPEEAWIEVDLRSTSANVIAACVAEVEQAVRKAVHQENARRSPGSDPLHVEVSTIGDRPCGRLDDEHSLVQIARDATHSIGRRAATATASTDANVPISLGVPAIAIGAGGTGGGVHTAAEWFDNTHGHLGLARALTIITGAAGLTACQ